jgi:hypothetical protein
VRCRWTGPSSQVPHYGQQVKAWDPVDPFQPRPYGIGMDFTYKVSLSPLPLPVFLRVCVCVCVCAYIQVLSTIACRFCPPWLDRHNHKRSEHVIARRFPISVMNTRALAVFHAAYLWIVAKRARIVTVAGLTSTCICKVHEYGVATSGYRDIYCLGLAVR